MLGNGAGLVMSTLDMIGAAGGAAADFCDVGGGARAERIAAALDIITSDDRVRALLVNIFGGITRGDEVARGVLAWCDGSTVELPLVVRLDGNNARRRPAASRRDRARRPDRDPERPGGRRGRRGRGAQGSVT